MLAYTLHQNTKCFLYKIACENLARVHDIKRVTLFYHGDRVLPCKWAAVDIIPSIRKSIEATEQSLVEIISHSLGTSARETISTTNTMTGNEM